MSLSWEIDAAARDATAAKPTSGRGAATGVGDIRDLTPDEKYWAGVQARNYTLNRHGENLEIFTELLDALGIDHDGHEARPERLIQCSRCHQHKPETEFVRRVDRPGGHSYHCRACKAEAWQLYKHGGAEGAS